MADAHRDATPDTPVEKAEVVDLLVAMGLALRAKGETHRARAYLRAANAIARTPDFEARLERRELRTISGIGPSIDGAIRRFAASRERPGWVLPPEEALRAALERFEVPKAFRDAPFADAPDLHCHTTWSDGTMTLDELVAYAEHLGARALGISDHSGSLRIARGLAPEEVRAQWEEIERVQKAHPRIRLLKGTECDILLDGRLDHPPEILRGFDYVIGSLHSKLRAPQEEQTERMLRALEQQHLTIVGHPTTRVPGHRPPANLDLPRVFAAAAEHGVALEVNGNAGRIDLDAKLARQALQAGARISLGSDTHYPRELLAFATARRMASQAGARERDIVNYDVAAVRTAP